jgi:molybdate transport system permease protein
MDGVLIFREGALSPLELEALTLSLRVSVCAVLCSLPLGIFAAWLLARRQFPGKILLDGLVHLPLVLPPVAVGYLLLLTMGRHGWVGGWLYWSFGISFVFNWKGAALASAVMAFPLMVRAIRLSFESVDRGVEAAAASLGAPPFDVFLRVTLPLSLPGIVAGIILAFARSLSEFGATITFAANIPGQTRTLPVALYGVTQTAGGDAEAMRLCLISIALALLTLVASDLLARRLDRRLKG